MIKFKSLAISLITVLFMVPVIFANEDEIITKNEYGEYVYETIMSKLVDKGISEEIKLVNKSSYPLKFISCTVRINGRDHDMRPIPLLKLRGSEGFDGFFKDDMIKEFPKFFGKDGRFSNKNNNLVRFTFKFMDHDADVVMTDVYENDNDICFVVSDVTKDTNVTDTGTAVAEQPVIEDKPEAKPEQKSEPVQTQPKAAKSEQKSEPVQTQEQIQTTNISEPESKPAPKSEDTIVVIAGKTYLLHDGKAYVVQEK